MIFIGIAAIGAGALASADAAPTVRSGQSWTTIRPAGPVAADRASVGLSRPITYATYVLRRPVIVTQKDRIALVATSMLDLQAPFRLKPSLGLLATSQRMAGVEWLHGDGWAMSAGYTSTKPARMLGRFDQAFGIQSNNFRTAKGVRLAAELLSGGNAAPRQSIALDARLQHVRMEDTALVGAGEKLGDARLALVFRRSW